MPNPQNTIWVIWEDRNTLNHLDHPGVYFLALTDKDISGQSFTLREEIIYIGMTNSKKGLKGRLKQFEDTMKGKRNNHGGAVRVRYKYHNHEDFFGTVYVSVCPFIVEDHNSPEGYRIKGDCAKHELVSIGDYLEKFGRLPEFNDQTRSSKK